MSTPYLRAIAVVVHLPLVWMPAAKAYEDLKDLILEGVIPVA